MKRFVILLAIVLAGRDIHSLESCVRRERAAAGLSNPTAASTPTPARAESLPAGKVVEKVMTLADAGQSYALYLPSNYTPGRQWPILYCFDP
ncbi:MAG: hypothetical protein LC742_02275, partial [Acidobacteria bacterium]|nr:hypothetical protein [Acidobacteriota bacterium]